MREDTLTRTTGIAALDELIDGVRIGDNLVYRAAEGTDLNELARAFAAAATGRTVVHVRLDLDARRGLDHVADKTTTLDWSQTQPDPERTLAARIDELASLDADLREGGVYIFDDLTEMQDRWGSAHALDFFSWACPRLFRRRTVALWMLHSHRHAAGFHRRLAEITQVIIDFTPGGDDHLIAEVRQADGRTSDVIGRRVRFRVVGDDAVRLPPRRQHLGQQIKAERTARGISQAELARRAGMTPSALSQVERGTSGLTADNLTRIWEILGVPFGPTSKAAGYRIRHRGAHREMRLAEGATGQEMLTGRGAPTVWRIILDASAGGRGPLIPSKTREVVVVVRGVVSLEIDGETHALHEGDVAYLDEAIVTGWANPGVRDCEVHWIQLPR